MLLCTAPFYAQIQFEKGYFITDSGTRTACYIKNIDWKNNPTSFEYKVNLDDLQPTTGKIDQVAEFGIDDVSKYRRFTVKTERSHVNANRLGSSKWPQFKEETLFLNVLAEGQTNLYVYQDGLLTKFFFDAKDHPIEQLVYIRYLTQNGEAAENNQFRQQLLNNLQGNITEADVRKIRYEQSQLIKLFEKHNQSGQKTALTYHRKPTEKPFAFKILAGAGLSSLELETPHLNYNQTAGDVRTDTEVTFRLGLEAEYKLPFNKNKWRIFIAPSYSKFETDYAFFARDLYGDGVPNQVEVSFSLFEIPIGIRHYFYLNEVSKFFVDAAYSINIFNNPEILYNAGSNPVSFGSYYNSRTLTFGFGYSYKKWSAAINLGPAKKFFGDAYYHGYRSTNVMLSYELF